MNAIEIRDAVKEDVGTILKFIKELAEYEKQPQEVKATEADLNTSLFTKDSTAHAIIALNSGKAIGFAVYFYNYSTWLGKNGLYLEDLYVSPEKRGIGAGKQILHYLANKAVTRGCGRFEWCCLDWNTPSIDFYKSIGAEPMDEWTTYRLSGAKLAEFASENRINPGKAIPAS